MNRPDRSLASLLLALLLLVLGVLTLQAALFDNGAYLPIVLKPFVDPYYAGPLESEPNNASTEADGPLRPDFAYTGYPNDAWDIFSLAVTKNGPITVEVTGHSAQGGQVQLRRAGQRDILAIDSSPPDYKFTYSGGTPGEFLVYVYVDQSKPYDANKPYKIKVSYPTEPVATVTPTRPGPTATPTKTPKPTATPTQEPGNLPTLRNKGFEQGSNGDWMEYSFQDYPLIVPEGETSINAHGGTYLAWLGGLDGEVSVLSQSVDIPASAPSFYLYTFFWIGSMEPDCSTSDTPDSFWLSVNDELVEGYVMCQDYVTGDWIEGAFTTDLGAWAGQTVNLQIVAFTDDKPDTYSNLFLDDLSFSKNVPVAGRLQPADPATVRDRRP